MNWKNFVVDWLNFNRRDRIAIISLIVIMSAIFLIPKFYSPPSTPEAIKDTSLLAAVNELEHKKSYQPYNRKEKNYLIRPIHQKASGPLFYFDPNTTSTEQWQKLGLRDKTIQIIQNYLSKGGKFKTAEDLKRIYGLFEDEYERLQPFIRFEDSKPEEKTHYSTDHIHYSNERVQKPKFSIVDINSSDTTQLIALPGIGSKLAQRIINFREKLGGFYSIEQVREVYGLHDSVFQKLKACLKLENRSLRLININTATLDELKSHPYIRSAIANAIIAYRNEHGAFKSVDELKNILTITDDILNRMRLYVIIN